MRNFIWANVALIAGISGYIGGILTADLVKVIVKDVIETLSAIFRGAE